MNKALKFKLILLQLILIGCSSEHAAEAISEKDKIAFKRCAEIVKGYGEYPSKFEYYPSESMSATNNEGREVVTLSFAYGNASGDKIPHKAECVLYPDGKSEMTSMLE